MSGLLDDTLPEPPPTGPGLFGDAPAVDARVNAPGVQAPAPVYRVLARKYRPTGFADLVGQEAMVRILRNAFAQGRIAHAWMLTGVRGVGKTTTARIIARALNCIGPDGQGGPTVEPCGVCPNCVAILADRHPDVVEMDAASHTGIDDVREVIDATRYRPLQARYKVFIIDEVHMLSRNAFNALLKTLEEPPPHVKFIFATTEIRKVPVTVLSRCQRFDLRRISVAELAGLFGRVAAAEGVAIEPGALDLIARAADGSARDGLSLLDQAIAQGAGAEGAGAIPAAQVIDMLGLADRGAVYALIEALLAGRPDQVLAATAHAHERGADMGLLLQDLLELTHTLTRLKAVPALRDGTELPEAERTQGAALADRLSMPVLARLWQMLLKGAAEVEQAPDRRAAAEMVLIRACYVAELPTPGELVRRLNDPAAAAAAPAGSAGPASPAPAPLAPAPAAPASAPGDDGVRAVANGAPVMTAHPAHDPAPDLAPEPPPPAGPVLANFRDVAQLAAAQRQAVLHGNLLHQVHLVRFAPGMIELRPEPDAPRNLASDLAKMLLEATGERWTIALSRDEGEPTLAEQGRAADGARRLAAADHPLVRAILDAFPGAAIAQVNDSRVDAYGLMPDLPLDIPLGEPDMPEFAPPDADYADFADEREE
ncbi:MAG: DNA polymerase III subunit gamma/tau [Janthinobacterium lividum]